MKRPTLGGPEIKLPSFKRPSLKRSGSNGGGPKRPGLKGPDIKAPKFVTDVVADLRDRHLLPLVGVLLIAIFAVPLTLSKSEPELSATTGQSGLPAPGTPDGQVRVVSSESGLRDYKRRLDDLTPEDPFVQQFTQALAAGDDTAALVTEGTGSLPTLTETFGNPGAAPDGGDSTTGFPIDVPGGGGGGGGAVPETTVETKFVSYEIDVRIVNGGSPNAGTKQRRKATVRRNLPELTMLPSRSTPAATFMGVTADRRKVLLLVSSDVKSTFGDGVCVIGSETCQLLALEPGLPQTFVYGENERTYRIQILKIERFVSDSERQAPLGGQGRQDLEAPRPAE